MDASLRPTGRLPVPVGVVGMIALMVLIETGLGRSDRFANDMAEAWRVKSSAARREATASDILCFGDSLVEFGVLPGVLEERLGGRGLQSGAARGDALGLLFPAQAGVAAGSRPRAVVVDFMPHQIVLNPGHEQHRLRAWPELATVGEAIDLGRTMRDADLTASILLGKVFASVEARPEIRAAIASGFKGEAWPLDDALRTPVTYRNLKANRGAFVMPTSVRVAADPSPSNIDFTSKLWDTSRFVFIDRFLRLAASHGIPVYWLVMPISPEYQGIADASGSDAQYSNSSPSRSDNSPTWSCSTVAGPPAMARTGSWTRSTSTARAPPP